MEEFTPPSKEQIAFNEVWKRFIIEKRPAGSSGDNGCSWLTPEGNRCAVGWLIPSEMMKKLPCASNQYALAAVVGRSSVAKYLRDTYSIEFLVGLEKAHDSSAITSTKSSISQVVIPEVFAKSIEEKLRDLAANRGLEIPGKD